MKKYEFNIICFEREFILSLEKSVELLNNCIDNFEFKIYDYSDKHKTLFKIDLSKTENQIEDNDIFNILNTINISDNLDSKFNFGIIKNYLFGTGLWNRFISIERADNLVKNNAVITTYRAKEILGKIPIEIYFSFWLLRLSLYFISGKYLSHNERKLCLFDMLMDKSEINYVIKTGNICLDCQIILDDYLDLYQIISMNSFLRIVGKLSRSENTDKQFDNYLLISKFYKKSEIIGSSKVDTNVLIETIITNLSKNQIVNTNSQILNFIDLKKEIACGKIDKVMNELINADFKGDSQTYNNLILLYSRFNQNNIANQMNLISLSDFNLESNKIIKALLEMIDLIEKNR